MPATAVDPSILRPLTAQEQIFWLLNFSSPIHPLVAAHVTGRTVPAQWRAALDAVQQRHPLLSVSIEPPSPAVADGSQPFFRQHSTAAVPIPLRVVPRDSVPRWEAELERELVLPFAPGQAPLARAVLIHEHERSIIILTASHSVADGVSLSLLIRDLLTALGGQLDPLPFPRSTEELLGLKPVAPAGGANQTARSNALSSSPSIPWGAPTIDSLQVGRTLTQKLREAARQHGTTVHGALCAAFALALRQQAPQFRNNKPVQFVSPVNIRAAVGAQDECGLYFNSPRVVLDSSLESSFWDMARLPRQVVIGAGTREAVLGANQAMQGLVDSGITKEAAFDLLHNVFAMDILLTNLGPTPYDSAFGELQLDSLWGPAVLGGLRPMLTIGAASTNGALCLLATSHEPIPRLLETAESILATACAQQNGKSV